ncbi:hypothetical protein PBRA_007899 [Plasmodiophora brassicae]|uniref:Periplasmic binding protein domain-containing protein n=1 Tax=Plasmodiophora brassicae TaxID=37360 RepID=A0A0G4IXY5_PLABS|nr:hypothetical protein PBRA_007899 [Plasmodiophora brassicae]
MLRVVMIFVLAAAPAIGSECPCKNRSAVSLVLLQYGDPTSDRPFAQTLAGFLEGSKAMRVRATPIHINPALRATNSLPGTTAFMNQHLDAIASMDPPPSGVILPLPNYPAIASKLSVLVSKGIPVISFGSGWSVVKNMANPPSLFHMGADEVATGKSAGGLAARIGGHRAMCLYDQSDDVALTDRCSGFARGFNTSCASTVDACPTQSLLIDSSDLTAMQIMLQDAIAANANLNVVVVSTGAIAAAVVRLIGNMALPYKIYVGCFISDQYTDALLASESLFFAVSRQEYLMGYLAATLLQYYVTTGQKFANPTISTGPVFLTPGYTTPKTASIDNVLVEQVVHGRAIDPFWGVYATGASEAARDVGLRFVNCDVAGSVCDGTRRTLTYRSPGNQFDLTTMATKLLTSASNAPNAMILSDPSTQVLGSTINQVVKTNGIPAVGVNAGGNDAESLGLLMFFGSNEPIAGQAAGKQLGIAGVTKALCVNHELGNSALTQRCQGLGTGLAAYRGVSDPTTVYTMLPISLTDVSGTATAITAALQNDPSINGVLVLGSAAVSSVLLPLQQAGWVTGHPSTDRVKAIGSFDLDGPLQAAIQAGYVLFTVLQQQHMQAYMPGIAMTLRSSTGLNLLESWILTGPSLMTNVGRSCALVGRACP